MDNQFREDVLRGLRAEPKYLPTKYFYDDRGSELFRAIMRMPEYYLTDCEYEILNTKSDEILKAIPWNQEHFEIIEFGAGDGSKTKQMLKAFIDEGADFIYEPIDISKEALDSLEENIKDSLPDVKINLLHDDYFSALNDLKSKNSRKIVLFMGSNIGNFRRGKDEEFLNKLSENLNKDDLLLIGFDLKKNPDLITSAYNDPHGITKEFNLNLLKRINRELDTNLDINNFLHYPNYDPVTGEAKSYLISLKDQTLEFGVESIELKYAEPIFVELSQKYDIEMISDLAKMSGFSMVNNFYDCKEYFVDSLWKVE